MKAKNATPVVEKSDDWLTDERVVYGMHARRVDPGQWIRGLLLFFLFRRGVNAPPGIDEVG